ncbi:MAG: alginate export family protein [Bythopirellula sp.]|nr:alginate export family protein [Bythopirellula sp.]
MIRCCALYGLTILMGFSVAMCRAQQPNPCALSHKPVFYANDFSYLDDPNYDGFCLGDSLKLLPVQDGEWGTIDFGGQLRARYHHEQGMGRVPNASVPRFEDTQTDFVLNRVRLYTNWQVNDGLRFYVEGIYADVTDDGGQYAPRPIDQNFGDFLNLFTDVALTDTIKARVGRQELLYGNQRLISPLDWANTRRTFDGGNLLYRDGDWAVDTFYTYLVPVIDNRLDEPDGDQQFYGTYATYSGFEYFGVDLYALGYDDEQPFNANSPTATDFSIYTTGVRIFGEKDNWLWEFEGGPQFGEYHGANLDHRAGFATAGIGRKWVDEPWQPTTWLYYDYASGNAAGDAFNGFNQLFPLGHKYFGFIDAVQRSNIQSPNILLTCKPGPKWNLLMWYWHFTADTAAPVPSIFNTPPQNDLKHLGDELDVLLTYTICPSSNIAYGWSHFWRGDKIIGTSDADFLYAQWELNF